MTASLDPPFFRLGLLRLRLINLEIPLPVNTDEASPASLFAVFGLEAGRCLVAVDLEVAERPGGDAIENELFFICSRGKS